MLLQCFQGFSPLKAFTIESESKLNFHFSNILMMPDSTCSWFLIGTQTKVANLQRLLQREPINWCQHGSDSVCDIVREDC